mgnify:CR=1 FL=1|tara:strand:+ start:8726 stop:9334 length:609 start_codon:yes stop_codon:yes gene_type:complete
MYLGFIITEDDYECEDKFICGSYEDSKEYPNLPKLIIGMSLANDISNDETDIIDRVLSDGSFWTFKKIEQRKYYTEDLENFKQYCYDKLLEDYEYEFIDPLMCTPEDNKANFRDIKNRGNIITYHSKDMVYLCVGGKVYGINLMFYQYIGTDKDSMIAKLKKISIVFLTEEDIIIEYKDYMERFDNQARYIPYLYSIINHVK